MELKAGHTYKTRDGSREVTVQPVSNGTNYVFCDANAKSEEYTKNGCYFSQTVEFSLDLVELVH